MITYTTFMPTPPSWKWKEAEKAEVRFTMHNEVTVGFLRAEGDYDSPMRKYTDIPMEFFQFCREVLDIQDLALWSFYLDEVEKGRYMFGIILHPNEDPVYATRALDLWCWTRASVPSFLTRR